ncbi:MAG: tRNA (adenosine(37)-N6)-threonylcarbamoyltransferase complex ATPase subunit type 1 TsaE [Sedimentisphaerales bacterium]|nr:tRNA (adenosine(37)-N6)-threonylcarbamoyltransferase complex ATPase subunit type 1 TsaE [Sedimentisphaerales bacterium]
MNDTQIEITSRSVDETIALGRKIAQLCQGGELIALIGQLGAGKTHLIKGIAQGLDVEQINDVTSPTFTLINEYPGRLYLVHIDAYRLENAQQLEQLGFDEYIDPDNVTVVEWADRVTQIIDEYDPITIRMHHDGPTQRKIQIQNPTPDITQALQNQKPKRLDS